MTDQPYNGSSALITEIEHLLGEKKLSTAAAMRLLLEKELSDIKANHERKLQLESLQARQDELEKRSLGFWAYKNPKIALTIFIALYSFSISDIRQPLIEWLNQIVGLLIKAL